MSVPSRLITADATTRPHRDLTVHRLADLAEWRPRTRPSCATCAPSGALRPHMHNT
jgi:hypothetical protein